MKNLLRLEAITSAEYSKQVTELVKIEIKNKLDNFNQELGNCLAGNLSSDIESLVKIACARTVTKLINED
jgi:hypothetical protein